MPISIACRLFTLAVACLLTLKSAFAGAIAIGPHAKAPQYVIISFDGAHDVALWKRSRALAAKTGAHFTYFLSCVFLLSPETRKDYKAPGKAAGRSNVGFALTKDEVRDRLQQIWLAHSEGHDIASHACGHFDGKGWSKADWLTELQSASRILREAYALNGIDGEPAGWRDFATATMKGFRAPYLSTSSNLYAALQDAHFAYDASGVSRGPAQPGRGAPVARFSLPQIPEGPSARRIIAMDYNLFVRNSGGFERADTDSVFENRAYDAFHAAFKTQYEGGRIPLQMGFHFVLMNGGAYWNALERFASEVCVKPDVKCVSYADYLARVPQGEKPVTTVGG